MNLYEKIYKREEKVALVGLGYVGLPIAVAFSKTVEVIGFDTNAKKIELYKEGFDPTQEVGDEAVLKSPIEFTADEEKLKEAKFIIVAVPTPIRQDKVPDLNPVEHASQVVGRNLTKGAIIVYESTVYPGVTEEICVPILERESGLKCGVDFKVGYSPERINPGDKEHRLENIVKIVSGMDAESLEIIARTYEIVIKAGVHRASTIKVAEAAKVIENAQRDVNIAFMNEIAMMFNRMGIDTKEVLEAAGTKWNFMKFAPGLVGGHCIGVDPYYLTYRSEQLGYRSQLVLAGRRVNDDMGKYIVENTIRELIKAQINISECKVAILGFTFKENCPDIRNTRVIDIINELETYGIEPMVCDPVADKEEAKREYGIEFVELEAIKDVDALIIAVAHNEFRELGLGIFNRLFEDTNQQQKVIIDVKGILTQSQVNELGYRYWRL